MRDENRKTGPPPIPARTLTPKKRAASEARPPDGLFTWREISDYAGRGVRTLQRWERNFGFPIHRPDQRHKSVVVSSKSEVDEWFRTRPIMQQGVMMPVRTIGARELRESAHKVEVEAERLQQSSREMRERLMKAMETIRRKKPF